MSDRIRAIDCPSCGAPLELPKKQQRLFKCNFCGTTLEDLTTPKEQAAKKRPNVVVHTTTVSHAPATRTPTAGQGSRRVGWIILFIILAIAGASIILPLWLSGEIQMGGNLIDQVNRIRIYSFGLTRLLPSDNDTDPDVMGVTYNADETYRMVYVDFDAKPHLRWQSEPLGEGSNFIYNHVVANNLAIYMAYETMLAALDRQDGAIQWEVELSDQVSHICQDCLQVIDDWVLALTDDGMLNGIDAQTGELAWSVRMNETPRQLVNLDGRAGVLDEEDGDIGLNVYAPETGQLIERIVPQCPNDVFPDSPQTLGIYDPILVTSDQKNIYIPISGYDPSCLQKLNPTTLAITQEARIPSDILEAMNWNPYLLSDEMLFTSDRNQLFAVNLLDGSYQEVLSDEDHNLIPLAEQNGILITLAERTRGSRRYFLWGVDINAQSLRWQFEPQAENFHTDSSDVVYAEGLWGVGTDTDQAILWEAFSEPGIITFTVLDLLDGSTLAENTFEVNQNDHSYWMQFPGWDGERVYLEMDARLWLFDALTGSKISAWP